MEALQKTESLFPVAQGARDEGWMKDLGVPADFGCVLATVSETIDFPAVSYHRCSMSGGKAPCVT